MYQNKSKSTAQSNSAQQAHKMVSKQPQGSVFKEFQNKQLLGTFL